jgi:hypothetical protein
MKIGARSFRRRSVLLAAAGILALVLTACTGRGGGQLPPGPDESGVVFSEPVVFSGPASFGFSFSCEDSGGINPSTGKLAIELSYSDKGTSFLLGSPFSIHGTVDQVDPVLESAVCIGQNPPTGVAPNELIFLGRYRLTSSPPAKFPSDCPTQETSTSPLCRFEVFVQDNDRNLAPSAGDFFSIKLSTVTARCDAPTLEDLDDACSQLPEDNTMFYARAGTLSSGNLTVDY